MQVQINSDRNIHADERLAEFVRDTLTHKLDRFSDHLTRIEVHLSDENSSSKNEGNDKRCLLEARPQGLEPIAVTEFAPTVGQAVTGAADKLQRKLSSVIGKLRDKQSHGQRPDLTTEEAS